MDTPFDTYFIPYQDSRAIKYSLWLWHKWHDGNNWALITFIERIVIEWKAWTRGTLKNRQKKVTK